MQFILASSSPRRRELLTSLGVQFRVHKPEVDETQLPGEFPLDYVRRLSVQKANAVVAHIDAVEGHIAMRAEPALILAADTVVILAADTIGVTQDGAILGKPTDADDARQMLRRLRQQPHTVVTAITLVRLDGGATRQTLTELTHTTVTMRAYSDAEIDAYIATGDPFDKAGAYAIQHEGFHPVAQIDGSYTNVVGLPLETLRTMLARIGYPLGE
jgi:septum formation protein